MGEGPGVTGKVLKIASRQGDRQFNSADLHLEKGDAIVCTPSQVFSALVSLLCELTFLQWDILSRRPHLMLSLTSHRGMLNIITYSSQLLSARPLDMAIYLQSLIIPYFPSLLIAMSKPAYLAMVEYSPTRLSSYSVAPTMLVQLVQCG
jgi:hypothetical protein